MRLLTIVAIAGVSSIVAADPAGTTDYVVKDGDTCLGISIGLLGDRSQLKTLHALNPQLGPTPHVLHAGQILRLPAPHAPDATLSHANNVVELRQAGADAWSPAKIGAELFRAWRVAAREHSNAGVVFADHSQIEMRENTVVVIYGGSSTSGQPRRATLETGALRSRLAQLDGRLEVDTPSGKVEVATGATVVEAKPKRTLVSNHQGKPARLRNAGAVTQVSAGFGADAETGKKPSPARPLPPAPTWTTVPSLALGWSTDGATLALAWTPAQAATYRIELRSTAGDVLAQLEVPGTATAMELHRIPAGTYLASISSVDSTGLEGIPAVTSQITTNLIALDGDAASSPTGLVDQNSAAAVRELPLGSELGTAGCTVDGKRVALRAGPAMVECTAGPLKAQLSVVVTPVAFSAPPLSLTLDQSTDVAVTLTPVPGHGDLVAHADPGIVIGRVDRTPHGATVHLTARRVGSTPIRIALASEGSETDLGRVTIDVAPLPQTDVVPRVALATSEHRVWVSAAGGASFDGPASGVGKVGVEVGVIPLLAIEAGGALSRDRHTADLGVALRQQIGSVVPMLRAGGVLDFDGHVGGRVGIAARVGLARRFGLYLGVDATFVGGRAIIDAVGGLAVGLQ